MRSNKAIAVSGCLIHQSLMAQNCEAAPAFIKAVVNWAMTNDIGLVPWTCPETLHAGLPRKTKGIEGYRKNGLIETSHDIANQFAYYLNKQRLGGVQILAIVGVSWSPACSASRQAYHTNEKGLFIQALERELEGFDISIPIIDVDRRKSDTKIIELLDNLLSIEPPK